MFLVEKTTQSQYLVTEQKSYFQELLILRARINKQLVLPIFSKEF